MLVFSELQRIQKGVQPSESWGPDKLENRINYKYAKEYQSGHALLPVCFDPASEVKQSYLVVGDQEKNGHAL